MKWNNWVVAGIPLDSVTRKEKEAILEAETVMMRAAEHLRSDVTWFGFLEDQERGFEMLENQLGLNDKNDINDINDNTDAHDKNQHSKTRNSRIKFEWSNKNNKNTRKVSPETRKFIEKLIPQDLWLYNYAKSLFEARYNFMKTGVWVEPAIPKLPTMHCESTRFILRCDNPAIYYQWKMDDKTDVLQRQLLPKFDDKLLFQAFTETDQ